MIPRENDDAIAQWSIFSKKNKLQFRATKEKNLSEEKFRVLLLPEGRLRRDREGLAELSCNIKQRLLLKISHVVEKIFRVESTWRREATMEGGRVY